MRLLDTETCQFVEKDPKRTEYAILSHTWDTEKLEQTYEQLREIQRRYDPQVLVPSSSDSPLDQRKSSSQPPLPQSPSDLSSSTALPAALGRFTQSEIEALLRLFGEVYGLTRPQATPTPALNDQAAPAAEPPATRPPQRKSIWDDPDLSPKIRDACALARKNGYRYIWIDSCCIDKSSSSELSEAINSMYKWYRLANVCYAYLVDVPLGADHHAEDSCFRNSRWFTRGWTLQELIAPFRVEFLSQDWAPIGSKQALVNLVENITGISARALLCLKPLKEFSVAQRFSWAVKRKTTRVEDRAYSLLGIFDINMPTLYGEGDRAFRRLQEQIMQRIPDQSLFAWGDIYLPVPQVPSDHIPTQNRITLITGSCCNTPSANSPDAFKDVRNIQRVQLPASLRHELEYRLTPYGIRAEFQMISLTRGLLSAIIPHQPGVELELKLNNDFRWYLAILGCEDVEHPGYLLGRVCCIASSRSEVEFMYCGFIYFGSMLSGLPILDLFLLSPEIVEQFRPHTELKTAYIPHPQSDCFDSGRLRSPHDQPYTAIKLVLLTETCDTLRSRGYSAHLRDPDPGHPTTQRLTLSKDKHTITIEFRYTLDDHGWEFTMDAEVKMSGCRVQLDCTPDSNEADCRTVSWRDDFTRGEWNVKLGHRTVELSTAGARVLTLGLSLDFAGAGFYFVQVDVQSDALPASADIESTLPVSGSAVELAGDEGKEVDLNGDDSPCLDVGASV